MNTNRSPQCDCDAWGFLCDQGRRCPHRGAAEAATDIGADAPAPREKPLDRFSVAVTIATVALWLGLAIAEWVAP